MGKRAVFVLLLAVISLGQSLQIQNLGGHWLLKDHQEKYLDIPAVVPGGIYTDLQTNNIIGDIYWRYNDNETRWVPRTNWTYYTTFEVDEKFVNHENIVIVFEGLDTFASVYINDEEVGTSENMFVEYVFDISKAIKAGNNTIEVRFLSPIEVSKNIGEQYIDGYVIPPECVPQEYQGECFVNQIRKMQASYSWDWGPSFPSVGIWKNVQIEAFDESSIRIAVPYVEKSSDEEWNVIVDVYFTENKAKKIKGTLKLEIKTDVGVVSNEVEVEVGNNGSDEFVKEISAPVKRSDVQTWWPNGYGTHSLYQVNVTFTNRENTETSLATKRIGFRTIELIQDRIESGLTFYFKINGEPIFMKGANEIPIDILPEKGQLSTTIKQLLKYSADAHMNMLRVWGGGVYESDQFYDTCDEMGILIWQDYMFASAYYPAHQSFLDNVRLEVRHQTKRMSGHASIALLAGNNENESNIDGNSGWYNQGDHEQYKKDYVKLTRDTIKAEIERVTSGRIIFLPSSPTNGIISEENEFISPDPNSGRYGDVHSYLYGDDSWDSNIYPATRFMSEYGLQSYPSMESLRTITNETEDFKLKSPFMEYRNHHPSGNDQIKGLIERQINLPSEESENYFNAVVFYSQIINGWSIKIATEHHRRYRSYINDNGEGYTMGTLYWQLNDVWVAPSWSGIDYLGRWKPLHYWSKNFFAPIIVTGHVNRQGVMEIYGVSDLLHEELNDLTFSLEVFNWKSFKPVATLTSQVTLPAASSKIIDSFVQDDFLSNFCGNHVESKNYCFYRLTLTNASNVEIAPENFVFPGKLKNVDLQTPDLKITDVVLVSSNYYEITVTTDIITPFVWIDTIGNLGLFNENGWTQVTPTKKVYLGTFKNTTLDQVTEALTITSIRSKEFL